MRFFRNIFFALAAFTWLPASAHCELETLPGFEFLRCTVEAAAPHGPVTDCDHCCAVEKSQYRTEHACVSPMVVVLQAVVLPQILPEISALPAEVTVGVLTAAPPEWQQGRQFFSRTALPARAPSLAS